MNFSFLVSFTSRIANFFSIVLSNVFLFDVLHLEHDQYHSSSKQREAFLWSISISYLNHHRRGLSSGLTWRSKILSVDVS